MPIHRLRCPCQGGQLVSVTAETPIYLLRCPCQGRQLVAGTGEIPTDMSERDARQRLQSFVTTAKISFHIDQTGLSVDRPGPAGAVIQKCLLVGSQTRELGFEQGKGLEVFHALYISNRSHSKSGKKRACCKNRRPTWNQITRT